MCFRKYNCSGSSVKGADSTFQVEKISWTTCNKMALFDPIPSLCRVENTTRVDKHCFYQPVVKYNIINAMVESSTFTSVLPISCHITLFFFSLFQREILLLKNSVVTLSIKILHTKPCYMIKYKIHCCSWSSPTRSNMIAAYLVMHPLL